MQPRPYQIESINAVWEAIRTRDDNPCLVLPTGAGKTIVIAEICREAVTKWSGRVLILAHVKELLAQSVDKLQKMCPGIEVGVYSAGLKRREKRGQVIVAGIQSVYQRACELEAFDLILVDEAHLIPPSGEGMYRTFLNDARVVNPLVRVIGLTATPYRMTTGRICAPGNILNHVCHEVGVKELIAGGFLCPVRSKAGRRKADLSEVHVRGGEWIESELQSAMMDPTILQTACAEIQEHAADRKSVLVFCCGIKHAEAVAGILGAECVFGDTLGRDVILERFKRGEVKYLCNVNVLTTGFDAPNIDCVAMLRPTLSPGLYYQMVGRGFRLCEGKGDCLVLDFGGNIIRHGPVDQIRSDDPSKGGGGKGGEGPVKECPDCHEVIAAGYSKCPACGHEFPVKRESKHTTKASEQNVISQEVHVADAEVHGIKYFVHEKKGAPEGTPRTMRVDYTVGIGQKVSEWVCVEHDGFALKKAEAWWRERSNDPFPINADDAVAIARAGGLAPALAIKVRHVAGEKFERIIGYELGPKPKSLADRAADQAEREAIQADSGDRYALPSGPPSEREWPTAEQPEDCPF